MAAFPVSCKDPQVFLLVFLLVFGRRERRVGSTLHAHRSYARPRAAAEAFAFILLG